MKLSNQDKILLTIGLIVGLIVGLGINVYRDYSLTTQYNDCAEKYNNLSQSMVKNTYIEPVYKLDVVIPSNTA